MCRYRDMLPKQFTRNPQLPIFNRLLELSNSQIIFSILVLFYSSTTFLAFLILLKCLLSQSSDNHTHISWGKKKRIVIISKPYETLIALGTV